MIEHDYESLFYNILKKIDKNDCDLFERIENSILQFYHTYETKHKNKTSISDLRIYISNMLRLVLTSYEIKHSHFEYVRKTSGTNHSYLYYPDYENIFLFNYKINDSEFYIAYDLTPNINNSYIKKIPDHLYKITIGFKQNKDFKLIFLKEMKHPEKKVSFFSFYIGAFYYLSSEIEKLPLHIKFMINNLNILNETEFEDLLKLNHDLTVKDIVSEPNNVLTSLKELIDISKL